MPRRKNRSSRATTQTGLQRRERSARTAALASYSAREPPLVRAELVGRTLRLVLGDERVDELVVQVGLSSITLHRDGKIVMRGSHVETHASGLNRIKGAQVKIN